MNALMASRSSFPTLENFTPIPGVPSLAFVLHQTTSALIESGSESGLRYIRSVTGVPGGAGVGAAPPAAALARGAEAAAE